MPWGLRGPRRRRKQATAGRRQLRRRPASAMIFVVSHEVIPETHRNGHQTPATLGLMAGFALMMVLDTSLG